MADKLPPLSPTVASIFGEFLKNLETENTLGEEAIESLKQALNEQRLDPESLRNAVFTPPKTAQ